MSSILSDIKRSLGVEPDVDEYDVDILMHLNSTLAVLYQVSGTNSGSVPYVTDDSVEWDALIDPTGQTAMIRSYIHISVRLLFDAPNTSFAINALKEQKTEYEWRLRELEHVFTEAALTQSNFDILNAKIEAESAARQSTDQDIIAYLDAMSTSEGSGITLQGVWQVNPMEDAVPGGQQVSSSESGFATNTTLMFTKIDSTLTDQSAVINKATTIYAHKKDDRSNWISYTVSGAMVDRGSYVELPVTYVDSGGTIEAAQWQLARFVFITNL